MSERTGMMTASDVQSSRIAGRERLIETADQSSVAKRVFPMLSKPGPRFF